MAVNKNNNILDHIPERFIDLYPEARKMKRRFILHIGPTNSGKTYEAIQAFFAARKGAYFAPLRLLAYEIYEESFSYHVPCSMVTGEEELLTEHATHVSCTIEMMNPAEEYDVAVIDEGQMIADKERGSAWTAAIIGVQAKEIHICASPDALPVLSMLIRMCEDTYEVQKHERSTPLLCDPQPFRFPKDVHPGDALIVFSKTAVTAVAAELQREGWKVSVLYGALPYDVRRAEVDRFVSGETQVVVATDAIGMGVNLPVQRVVFLETKKFDGTRKRNLSTAEIQQIAGRAGRKGMYEYGLYTAEYGKDMIQAAVGKQLPKIQKVYIPFPETLIHTGEKLSDVILEWNKLRGQEWIQYEKKDAFLCRTLEAFTKDRVLIWKFLNIPFNSRDISQEQFWKKLFFLQRAHGRNAERYLEGLIPVCPENVELMQLEDLSHRSDILYAYMRQFGHRAYMDKVLSERKKISDVMIRILRTRKLPERKCRRCKKILQWNYPYGVCQECYYGWDDLY